MREAQRLLRAGVTTRCGHRASDAPRHGSSAIVMGFASNRYGVAMLARASQSQVVNVAQDGGVCAVMVGAQAMHTREYRIPTAGNAERPATA